MGSCDPWIENIHLFKYRKVGILSTGAYFHPEWVLIFERCSFSRDANKHVISGSAQLCGNGLAVYILGLEVVFLLSVQ